MKSSNVECERWIINTHLGLLFFPFFFFFASRGETSSSHFDLFLRRRYLADTILMTVKFHPFTSSSSLMHWVNNWVRVPASIRDPHMLLRKLVRLLDHQVARWWPRRSCKSKSGRAAAANVLEITKMGVGVRTFPFAHRSHAGSHVECSTTLDGSLPLRGNNWCPWMSWRSEEIWRMTT